MLVKFTAYNGADVYFESSAVQSVRPSSRSGNSEIYIAGGQCYGVAGDLEAVVRRLKDAARESAAIANSGGGGYTLPGGTFTGIRGEVGGSGGGSGGGIPGATFRGAGGGMGFDVSLQGARDAKGNPMNPPHGETMRFENRPEGMIYTGPKYVFAPLDHGVTWPAFNAMTVANFYWCRPVDQIVSVSSCPNPTYCEIGVIDDVSVTIKMPYQKAVEIISLMREQPNLFAKQPRPTRDEACLQAMDALAEVAKVADLIRPSNDWLRGFNVARDAVKKAFGLRVPPPSRDD